VPGSTDLETGGVATAAEYRGNAGHDFGSGRECLLVGLKAMPWSKWRTGQVAVKNRRYVMG
jgi:hypothetical protein